MHPEHPLELVQVQSSTGALDDERPVEVLDAVHLQLLFLGLRLLTLAHSKNLNNLLIFAEKMNNLKSSDHLEGIVLRPPHGCC